MSEWLLAHDLPYRDSTEKAYSTDANIWGATTRPRPGAPRHRHETVARSWACGLDPAVEIAAEDVTIGFDQGAR